MSHRKLFRSNQIKFKTPNSNIYIISNQLHHHPPKKSFPIGWVGHIYIYSMIGCLVHPIKVDTIFPYRLSRQAFFFSSKKNTFCNFFKKERSSMFYSKKNICVYFFKEKFFLLLQYISKDSFWIVIKLREIVPYYWIRSNHPFKHPNPFPTTKVL